MSEAAAVESPALLPVPPPASVAQVSSVGVFPAKLAMALAKAQGLFTAAAKDRTADVKSDKGNYSYTYATLAAVWEVIRAPLSSNGLAVIQLVSVRDVSIAVRTILAHESGESVETTVSLPIADKRPQGFGAIISYGRRYGLSALVGVVTDDDDEDELPAAPVDDARQAKARADKVVQQTKAAVAAARAKTAEPPMPAAEDDETGASPVLAFGPFKGKRVASLKNVELEDQVSLAEAQLKAAKPGDTWPARVSANLDAIRAELERRATESA